MTHLTPPFLVIQLSKLAGFSPIITTASLRNADNLKSQGATHVLDRNLSDDALLAEVQKIATAPIKLVFDAVSEPKTQKVAYKAVAPGGTLAIVLVPAVEAVDPEKRIVQTQGNTNIPQHRKLGASLYSKVTALLEEGALKVSATITQSQITANSWHLAAAEPCRGASERAGGYYPRSGEAQARRSQREARRSPSGDSIAVKT